MLHAKQTFTTFDLVKAYHQIRVFSAERPKTAINTPFGVFEYKYVLRPNECGTNVSTFFRWSNQGPRLLIYLEHQKTRHNIWYTCSSYSSVSRNLVSSSTRKSVYSATIPGLQLNKAASRPNFRHHKSSSTTNGRRLTMLLGYDQLLLTFHTASGTYVGTDHVVLLNKN